MHFHPHVKRWECTYWVGSIRKWQVWLSEHLCSPYRQRTTPQLLILTIIYHHQNLQLRNIPKFLLVSHPSYPVHIKWLQWRSNNGSPTHMVSIYWLICRKSIQIHSSFINSSTWGWYQHIFNCHTIPEQHKALTSFGRRDMKSRWNWGSITCIMCRTWVGSHVSISRSIASNRSAFDHLCNDTKHKRFSKTDSIHIKQFVTYCMQVNKLTSSTGCFSCCL